MHLKHNPLVTWGTFWTLVASLPTGLLGASLAKRSLAHFDPNDVAPNVITGYPRQPEIMIASQGPNHSQSYQKYVMKPQVFQTKDGQVEMAASVELGHKSSHKKWANENSSGSVSTCEQFVRSQTVTRYKASSLNGRTGYVNRSALQQLISAKNSQHSTPQLEYTDGAHQTVRPLANQPHQVPQSDQETIKIEEIHDEDSDEDEHVGGSAENHFVHQPDANKQGPTKPSTTQSQPVIEELHEDHEEKDAGTSTSQQEKSQFFHKPGSNNQAPIQPQHSQSEPLVEEPPEEHEEKPAESEEQHPVIVKETKETPVSKQEEEEKKTISSEEYRVMLKWRFKMNDEEFEKYEKWLEANYHDLYSQLVLRQTLDLQRQAKAYVAWRIVESRNLKKFKDEVLWDHAKNAAQEMTMAFQSVHLNERLELLHPELTKPDHKFLRKFAESKGLDVKKNWTDEQAKNLYAEWDQSPKPFAYKLNTHWSKLKDNVANFWSSVLKFMKKKEEN